MAADQDSILLCSIVLSGKCGQPRHTLASHMWLMEALVKARHGSVCVPVQANEGRTILVTMAALFFLSFSTSNHSLRSRTGFTDGTRNFRCGGSRTLSVYELCFEDVSLGGRQPQHSHVERVGIIKVPG